MLGLFFFFLPVLFFLVFLLYGLVRTVPLRRDIISVSVLVYGVGPRFSCCGQKFSIRWQGDKMVPVERVILCVLCAGGWSGVCC